MSDTFITSESDGSGTAVTTDAPETGAPGSAAPENTESQAGTEKSGTEDGHQEPGSGRKRTVYDDLRDLRAQRREWREQQGQWQQERQQILDELRQLREAQTRPAPGNGEQPRKNFWQDPEGTLDAKLEERLSRLEDSLANRFDSVRQREAAEVELHQRRTSAVEFIRSQKGYDPSDDEDLAEIIYTIPNRESLDPQFVAEYAWMKLNQARGVGDRSAAKRQASSVVGQPPGAGLGRKQYSQAEFDQATDQAESMLRKNPNDPQLKAFLDELYSAVREGRVK